MPLFKKIFSFADVHHLQTFNTCVEFQDIIISQSEILYVDRGIHNICYFEMYKTFQH
jgi:ATP adenylyltransferase/5',5'''-P-1,P-4-tetraphosphate phosphorylase II